MDDVMTVNVTLRRASLNESDRLARLYLDSQRHVGTAASRGALKDDVAQRWLRKAVIHNEVWVLERQFEESAQLAGMLALTENELDLLDVHPQHRGRGYGEMLIAHAKKRRPGGLRARLSHGKHDARAFLVRHGFTPQKHQSTPWEDLLWGTTVRTA